MKMRTIKFIIMTVKLISKLNNMDQIYKNNLVKKTSYILGIIVFWCLWTGVTFAASLSLSPSTGVYTAGNTFTVQVRVNTAGKPVNAADATLKFNPNELKVVSANRSGSIFNLWVAEPSFSNSAGTISFSGGSPTGYTGGSGNIMNVTFRAATAGTARVSFSGGSVLAMDGKGTNVLTNMAGGTYTLKAKSEAPAAEVIEYIAPANTPSAPKISSETHGDPSLWYSNNSASLTWILPSDVTTIRTLLDSNLSSVPTKVYESPIRTITLSDLPEGESYFHIQFKNSDGWGRVTHFRLGVDTVNPTEISISQDEGNDYSNPIQTLNVRVENKTSLVDKFKIKIDSDEPYTFVDDTASGTITLPKLDPGYHSVIIEAFDRAGNNIVGSYTFTIEAFTKPVFIEFPNEINDQVIPVIKGETRPNSSVEIYLEKVGSESVTYEVKSDESGIFVFIPEGTFTTGVYEISARSTDAHGAQSEMSDIVRIAVQQPGYLRIGTMLVSALSVIVPLLLLVALLFFGIWRMFTRFRNLRRNVRVESSEALEILRREFTNLQKTLRDQESKLQKSRSTKKLTKAESTMIEVIDLALQNSQQAVEKEISDVTILTNK